MGLWNRGVRVKTSVETFSPRSPIAQGVGPMWGPRSERYHVEKPSAPHVRVIVGIGGEPVSSYRTMVVVLRKLHPHGGDRCGRKRCQVRACAGAQKRDLARSR